MSVGDTTHGTSTNALDLREGDYAPVIYLPRKNIDLTFLDRTTRASRCHWKGKASYYSIRTPLGVLENAVWFYEDAPEGMAATRGHLAFFTDRVTVTRGWRFRESAPPSTEGRSTAAR